MGTRTVRLDEEAEQALREIQAATGMPISTALKRGLRVIRDEVVRSSRQVAYDIYCQLDSLRKAGGRVERDRGESPL